MGVQTAFLNGKVTTEVYINQPKGYDDGSNKVYKLRKALYGLKKSPRYWYDCFDEYITKLGFKKTHVDLYLYSIGKGEDIIYLLIYVDDLLICGKDKRRIRDVKKSLTNRIKMKDLGELKEYLGINVDYDYCNQEMKLSQTKYIESLANK